jgi:hypothetical protein
MLAGSISKPCEIPHPVRVSVGVVGLFAPLVVTHRRGLATAAPGWGLAALHHDRRAYRSVKHRKIVGGWSILRCNAADFSSSAVSGAKYP